LARIERPVGVVLIAVANLLIYVGALVFVISPLFTAHTWYYDGAIASLIGEFIAGVVVTYSIVGIIGVLCLILRWKSFRYLAMIGWAVECVIFSILGVFWGWSKGYLDSSYIIIYNYQAIFLAVSIVLIKIISIAYFATKENPSFHTK
jgi:hypothetical protein